MLNQRQSVVEWCSNLSRAQSELLSFQDRIDSELFRRTESSFRLLEEFAQDASLVRLDRALGILTGLRSAWDHLWWIARRTGQAWPVAAAGESPFQVVRQAGWSRITWSCPHCQWEMSWQCESAAWQQLVWPGPVECPMGCANASSDDLPGGQSPASVFAK